MTRNERNENRKPGIEISEIGALRMPCPLLRPVPFHSCLGAWRAHPSRSLVSTPRGVAHRQSRADRQDKRQPARACQQPGRASWRLFRVACTSHRHVASHGHVNVRQTGMITSCYVSSRHVSGPIAATLIRPNLLTSPFLPCFKPHSFKIFQIPPVGMPLSFGSSGARTRARRAGKTPGQTPDYHVSWHMPHPL